MKKKWRTIIFKVVVYGFILFLVLLASGSIYEWASKGKDLAAYKPTGELYDVDGRKMHAYADGQGDVTVVFATGWGTANSYVDYYPLYEKLSSQVKFVVYDRFGYGYSDNTDKKRDIDTITNEIHELLQVSGQKPPYILVGHSLGSLEVIRFAQKYPDEVKGIVFVDAGSPEYYASRKSFTIIPLFQRFLVKTGVVRALYHMNGFAEDLADERNGLQLVPDELKEMDRLSTLLKTGNSTITDEMRQARNNARTVLNGNKPLNVPITVLTADYFGKADKIWEKYQAEFTSWSTTGKQIVVKNTAHYIHQYEPDLVASEILAISKN